MSIGFVLSSDFSCNGDRRGNKALTNMTKYAIIYFIISFRGRGNERHYLLVMTYKKITDRHISRKLALLCAVTYVASYMTRVNFAAVTVEIIRDTGWDKTSISAVTTGLFIAYGLGQFVSGWLGDRMAPNRLMTAGLLTSICMNLLIPLCTGITQMTVIWCVNGLAQAMLWPPIVRIMAGYCTHHDYQDATVIVSWGSSVGTLLVYLISSLCIAVSGWRTVFYICAGTALVICACWVMIFPRFAAYAEKNGVVNEPEEIIQPHLHHVGLHGKKHPVSDDSSDAAQTSAGKASACGVAGEADEPVGNTVQKMPRVLYVMLAVIMLAVIVLGALRDSITAWLPSYISETFNLGTSSAVLTGIIIPVLTTLIYPPVLAYYRRFFTNELACASTIYGVSAVAALLLYFVYDSSPIVAVLLLALICACMHGANFLMIGLIPKRFDRYGNVALISGVINCFVYTGSSLSIWGIAAVADSSGWRATIAVWGVAALAGVLFCLIIMRRWTRLFGRHQ